MRITNKIMQNNSLSNINNNKILQDNLNTQISTQKKITRPSDDPVVAIRALRLRTNLSEITQYYEKNVEDAESWLSVTEDALGTVTEVITDMYEECQKGAEESLTAENRKAILENLKELRDEIYSTGDADYAGRSIFTGYRTQSKLLFQEDTTQQYLITEKLTKSAVDSITYVDSGSLKDLNTTNYDDVGATTEQGVASSSIARIRLSYDTLSTGVTPSITINGTSHTMTLGTTNPLTIPGANDIVFIPESGELLLGSNVNATIQALPSSAEINITYEKKSWSKGDLRPEHYFTCTADSTDPTKKIEYSGESQVMSYDVGYNQTVRINTLANECYTHNIGRDVDALTQATQAVIDIQSVISTLESMQGNASYTQEDVEARLAAAKKAETLLIEKEQSLYSSSITKMQSYLDQTNLAMTNCGSRSARLELVSNRLQSQQTNFKALVSENEGCDVTEVAVQLSSAEMAYDAALMATSKIVQNSLMNYI
ncbi:MAG: flagellar hook-associated protein FlgL [Lachnospiraceae bacterium]|nr:flagellar hook-associated protein FlgL [Lachnospiraceae bacterium]